MKRSEYVRQKSQETAKAVEAARAKDREAQQANEASSSGQHAAE